MIKYYISVIALGIFVLVLIVTGVVIAGSPISQKDIQLDNIRIQAFNDIKYQTENYYKVNRKLPSSLIEIKSLNIKDPETKNDYEYKTQPPYGYQLCTTFSTDNSEIIDRSGYANYDSDSSSYKKHKKGYDCLSFKISDYVINSRANEAQSFSPAILNVNSSPKGIVMTSMYTGDGGTTNYTKTGSISTRIDAPLSSVVDGKTYVFNSWSGCDKFNGPPEGPQYCFITVASGNTITIVAKYTTTEQSLPTPTPTPTLEPPM